MCLLLIENGGHKSKRWKCSVFYTFVCFPLKILSQIFSDVALGRSHRMHTGSSVHAVLYRPCLTDGKTKVVEDQMRTAIEFQNQTEIPGSFAHIFSDH